VTILQRIFGSWRTTVGGVSVGAAFVVIIGFVLSQFDVHLSDAQWALILGLVGLGPTVVGAMATDNKQGV
jgi:hypothetical protein